MRIVNTHAIARAVEFFKYLIYLRVPNGLRAGVAQKVLLRYISDIFAVIAFGQKVIKRLVFLRADFGGNRQPPFFGIAKRRVDVKNYPAKSKNSVLNYFTDLEFCFSFNHLVPFLAFACTVCLVLEHTHINR